MWRNRVQFRYPQGKPYKFLSMLPTDKECPFDYNDNRRYDILIIKEHSQRLYYGMIADKPGKLFRWLLS